jgi:hypothetical protein
MDTAAQRASPAATKEKKQRQRRGEISGTMLPPCERRPSIVPWNKGGIIPQMYSLIHDIIFNVSNS